MRKVVFGRYVILHIYFVRQLAKPNAAVKIVNYAVSILCTKIFLLPVTYSNKKVKSSLEKEGIDSKSNMSATNCRLRS